MKFHTPIDARRHGIETVYQDLALASAMTFAENLFLGRELRKSGVLGAVFRLLDKKSMDARSVRAHADLQIGIAFDEAAGRNARPAVSVRALPWRAARPLRATS